MFARMNDARKPDCVSDLRLDELLADELRATSKDQLIEHLARCAFCRERFETLSAQRALFQSSELASPSFLAPAGNAWRRRASWLAGACALAASVLLLTLPREGASERSKGGDHLSFFVKRGEVVHRGSVSEPLHPQDQLRFAYTTTRPRYLAILSVDALNQVSVYYPEGERALQLQPGEDALLPSAIELDTTLGKERVVAVFCDQPLELSQVRRELAMGALTSRADCSVDLLTLRKVPTNE